MSVTCNGCGSTFTEEEFVASHPGEHARDAWSAAIASTLVRCPNCPPVVMDTTRVQPT